MMIYDDRDWHFVLYMMIYDKWRDERLAFFFSILIEGEFEKHADDSDSENEGNGFGENAHHDLCLPALRYLKQCADYLASMWLMPNCPLFVGAQRWLIWFFLASINALSLVPSLVPFPRKCRSKFWRWHIMEDNFTFFILRSLSDIFHF